MTLTPLQRCVSLLLLLPSVLLLSGCFLFGGNSGSYLPTGPSVTANVDAGTPPPIVVVTPPPEDSTTSPTVGDLFIADIELPSFIVGGDDDNGRILFARRTTQAITLTFSTSDRDVEVAPATVSVAAGESSAGFRLKTHAPHADTPVRVTAAIGAESRTATFTLALPRPINRADAYTAISGQALVVAAPGILENDTRRQGHDLAAVLLTKTDHGTLSLNAAGGFSYLADQGYTGHDRFIYRAIDGVVSSGAAHVNITVVPAPAPPNVSGSSGSSSFAFTGANQTFTVPAGVSLITINASGAQGGASNSSLATIGGAGGNVVASFAVTAGETLTVVVGGVGGSGGQAGFNGGGASPGSGGGGGGASDVRRGGTRLVIAGGGGGSGHNLSGAGPAGGLGGGAGTAGDAASAGGGGGTQAAGGAGGAGINAGVTGTAGSANTGGAGGTGNSDGGGGGGGFFGGGGGGGATASASTGGGGGSSFVASGGTNVSHSQGARVSNGLIVITW